MSWCQGLLLKALQYDCRTKGRCDTAISKCLTSPNRKLPQEANTNSCEQQHAMAPKTVLTPHCVLNRPSSCSFCILEGCLHGQSLKCSSQPDDKWSNGVKCAGNAKHST